MPKHQPLPIFRSMCIVGMACLLLAFVCSTVDLLPFITSLLFVAGAGLIIIGALGWLITGFGL